MPVTAKLKYLRISPRKVRLAADLIRGKSAQEAENILNFTVKKATLPLMKLLKQALASAQNNLQLGADNLYIFKITVDEGPKLKRWRPRARGQAYEIQKKTSHVTIVLDEKIKAGEKRKKTKKAQRQEQTSKEVADKKTAKERVIKTKRPRLQIKPETAKPKPEKGPIKKIFRRKAF